MTEIASLIAPDVSLQAVAAVRDALSTGGPQAEFTLHVPRSTAEKVLELLVRERKGGALVLPAREELTPAQAALVLGVSRQTVVRMIDGGRLPARKVGAHWRITASDVKQAVDDDRAERLRAALSVAQDTSDDS